MLQNQPEYFVHHKNMKFVTRFYYVGPEMAKVEKLNDHIMNITAKTLILYVEPKQNKREEHVDHDRKYYCTWRQRQSRNNLKNLLRSSSCHPLTETSTNTLSMASLLMVDTDALSPATQSTSCFEPSVTWPLRLLDISYSYCNTNMPSRLRVLSLILSIIDQSKFTVAVAFLSSNCKKTAF